MCSRVLNAPKALKPLFNKIYLRHYSQQGRKKLSLSFKERNTLLNEQLHRSEQYPLLTVRLPDLPVERICTVANKYKELEHMAVPETPELEVRGRVNAVRFAGKRLMFVDIEESGHRLQVVVNTQKLNPEVVDSETGVHELLRHGDSISAVGRPWRTKAGELSLLASHGIKLLSPNLRPLPDATVSRVLRKHNRVVELKSFQDARDVLRARDLIIRKISDFLRENDFLQVQTPHLSTQRGGASAKTFETKMADDGTQLHLRVAPELWLKRLIIGGFDRVFEVGNSYRNEAVDGTHNPEFTTCEFYMAFGDLPELMQITQTMLKSVAEGVSHEFPQYTEFCTPLIGDKIWPQLDFVTEIEKGTGKSLSLDTDSLQSMCTDAGISVPQEDVADVAALLDKLAGHYIEPKCTDPTFIVNHPSIMAPLAKQQEVDRVVLSRRFELFIGGVEYVNAYEEENDPVVQLANLKAQNTSVPDRDFVDSLEWGLPPTGGWGMGVDRLVMLLTNSPRICDVLSFGDMSQLNRL